MTHINKIIKQGSEPKPQESTARWSKRTECLVSALFVRFADNGIEQVEKQIARNAEKGEKSYPPSYAEFIGLANRKETPPASHKSWAGLPAPTMSLESRKSEMQKILNMLR